MLSSDIDSLLNFSIWIFSCFLFRCTLILPIRGRENFLKFSNSQLTVAKYELKGFHAQGIQRHKYYTLHPFFRTVLPHIFVRSLLHALASFRLASFASHLFHRFVYFTSSLVLLSLTLLLGLRYVLPRILSFSLNFLNYHKFSQPFFRLGLPTSLYFCLPHIFPTSTLYALTPLFGLCFAFSLTCSASCFYSFCITATFYIIAPTWFASHFIFSSHTSILHFLIFVLFCFTSFFATSSALGPHSF